MTPPATPPGWPDDLPPPQADQFGDKVVAWLLDRAPGQWRAHAVLRRHPRALAQLVSDHLGAELAGLRQSYASARRLLGDVVPADEMPQFLAAVEAQGSLTAEELRQVEQVREALAGREWRARL
jgi:hypothetical protein